MPVDMARVDSARAPQAPASTPRSADDGRSLSEQQGLTSRADRFQGADGKDANIDKSLPDLNRLQMYSKLQRPTGVVQTEPMIARTVSLSIIAKDFDTARTSLDGILARHHGYAANLSANTPQGAARSIQASLRIPAPQLTAALAELKSLGRVELENQNGEEVTQQHADLLARLKNSRETE
ncbi:MAG: DUF4349 domain-containing protein, partial [Terriglobales bacterium]